MAIRYLSGINVDSNTLFVDSTNNRVGIGTGSPAFPLTVYHATNSAATFQTAGTGTGAGNGFYVGHTGNISYVWNYNNFPIVLATNNSERLRITEAGSIGIGTTAPTGRLHITGVTTFDAGLLVDGDTTNGVGFGLRNANGHNWYLISTGTGNGGGENNLGFYNSNVGEYRVYFKSDGNVGIGTVSPSTKLHTVGNIRSANAGNTVYSELQNDGVYAVGTDLYLLAPASKFVSIYAGNAERMRIASTGATRLNAYGSGSITGTATYGLAVDSSGNIIEVTSTIDGSGTANYVTKWQDSNTLTNSVIYDNGTNVGIGTLPTQGVRLQVAGSVDVWSSLNTLLRLNHDGTRGVIESYTGGGFSPTALNPSGGNVLVGTTSDVGHLLYVNGTSRFNGVIHGASRLMVGITSDQTYASIFVGGDITTGGSQYALLLDPQLSGTNNYGLFANARIKASHAATNAYGVYIVNNELMSGASVVNNYGLYIANQTSGSSVNYALYSAGGTSYFAGSVGIGTGSPNAPLHIVKDLGTSVSAVLRLRGSNSTARTTRLQFEDYNGTIADGLIDFIIPTAGSSTGARLDIGVDSTIMSLVKGGNVGIGTTSPTNTLDVLGSATIRNSSGGGALNIGTNSGRTEYQYITLGGGTGGTDYGWQVGRSPQTGGVINDGFYIYDIKTNNAPFTIALGGNVGIGTNNPARKLTVQGADDGTMQLRLMGTASQTSYWDIGREAMSTGQFRFIASRNGSIIIPMVIDDQTGNVGIGTTSPSFKLDVNGNTRIGGNSGSNTARLNVGGAANEWVADFQASTTTNQSYGLVVRAGTSSTDFPFYVLDSSSSTAFFAIKGNGNVGIGTTSPNRNLTVSGNGTLLGLQSNTVGGYSEIEMTANGVSAGYIFKNSAGYSGYAGAGALNIYNSGSIGFHTASVTNAMFIASGTGNVGIGTTSPDYKLSVNESTTNPIAYFGLGPSNASSRNSLIVLQSGTIPQNGSDTTGEVGFLFKHSYGTGGVNGTANGGYIESIRESVFGITSQVNTALIFGTSAANTDNERMRINSAGNVGIGNSSPQANGASAVLDVGNGSGGTLNLRDTNTGIAAEGFNQIFGGDNRMYLYAGASGASSYMQFYTNDVERMRIHTNGNFGVGTTNPIQPLTVSAIANANTIALLGRAADNASRIDFYNNAGNSRLYTIALGNGAVEHYADANIPMVFSTNAAERMRITAAGNVGIGTTAPGAKLEVVAGNTTSISVRSGNSGQYSILSVGRTSSDIIMASAASSGQFWTGSVAGDGWIGSTNGTLSLGNDTTGVANLTIKSGNVGIGTTAPGSKLSVSGSNTGSVPLVDLVASGSGAFQRGVRMLNSGMVAGDSIMYAAGRSDNSKNMGQFYFYYAGDGSNSNRISMGLHSVDDVFNINGSGNVGIGTTAPSQPLHVTGNIRVTGAYYDSNNEAGTSGQVLSSTGSGTDWITPATTTATSLYDLLPAARVAFNWTGQVVNDTWTTVFSKSSNLLTTGTWMVKMYVSDFATGGGHYTYTYSGMFTWYQDTTNQGGEQAASEIYLHRMGHAANASVLYLRTTETAAASSGDGLFQIKGNYSNTSNQTISFQFVKIF